MTAALPIPNDLVLFWCRRNRQTRGETPQGHDALQREIAQAWRAVADPNQANELLAQWRAAVAAGEVKPLAPGSGMEWIPPLLPPTRKDARR